MSDTKTPTTDPDQASIDLLEKSIQDNSPEFLKDLEEISEIGSENLDLELVDIEQVIAQQEANSFKARAKRLLISLNQLGLKIFYFVKACLIRFAKESGPHYLKLVLAGLKSGASKMSDSIGKIKKLGKLKKLALMAVVIGTAFAVYLVFKLFTSGLIKEDEKLFVHSMDELSGQKYVYTTDQMEDFYNSPRVSQNIMALRRIVVNLQRSKNASSNPMGAFEFFLQGNSSDVMVEISDREAELIDLFQNQIREFSYDELDTIQGKRSMLDKLIHAMNATLTKGKITQIYFKNFVLKK